MGSIPVAGAIVKEPALVVGSFVIAFSQSNLLRKHSEAESGSNPSLAVSPWETS